ncbi:vWA domain-containing protein [Rhizobium sp. YIM 134829]|uniref:vWA domain-containing protein n=1 Tax=Rhizobium sp. YIM 134829 TaxID=3390453 RepID=UPI0039799EC6
MDRRTSSLRLVRAFARERGGNFAMMGALLLPMLIGAAGVGIDVTRLVLAKTELQDAVDVAALAASSGLANEVMTVDQAKAVARNNLVIAMSNAKRSGMTVEEAKDADDVAKNAEITIDTSATGVGSGKKYTIIVSASSRQRLTPLSKMLGLNDVTLSATGQSVGTTATESALSMFLVLDRSGSMGEKTNITGVNKIQSLKLAVAGLLTQMTKADPNDTYVRTAAVSYNGQMDTPSAFTWTEKTTLDYVNALTAKDSTNSSKAMETAFTSLTNGNEDEAHRIKNGLVPKKFIVFMTDGDNTSSSYDTATKKTCNDARAKNVTVYTVAFMAPAKGKSLLQSCATSPSHYFPAENANALIAAFASIGRDASQLAVRLTK